MQDRHSGATTKLKVSVCYILLSVKGSKLVGVRCHSLQKKFDYIVYVAAESRWENTNNNESLVGAYYAINLTKFRTTKLSEKELTYHTKSQATFTLPYHVCHIHTVRIKRLKTKTALQD